MTLRLDLADAEATEALGRRLASAIGPEGLTLALAGPLGAGKSTLARALLRGLGVTGTIRSPTYTLVEPYPEARLPAAHLDLYRIADPGELHDLGIEELAGPGRVLLVEWPERAGALLDFDLCIELDHADPGRRAELVAVTTNGSALLDRLAF